MSLSNTDVLSHITDALNYIPKRPSYDEWLIVISAIANTLPQDLALHILLQHFDEEKHGETKVKIDSRLRSIGIGSFFKLAADYGYQRTRTQPTAPLRATVASKPKLDFRGDKESCYISFDDEELEERAAIMEYDGGMRREQADELLLQQNPDCKHERSYRIAINAYVKDKNYSPKALAEGFENKVLTRDQIIESVCVAGHAFCCGHLSNGTGGHPYRANRHWIGSELIAVDVDNGMSIAQAQQIPVFREALLCYTTASHTPEHNRFRILFALPSFETVVQRYQHVVRNFIYLFNGDKQCSDPARAYLGNSRAHIIQSEGGCVD